MNCVLSGSFPICNETRQGCPLIFDLTLEPLLNKIRLNSAIKDFVVGPTEHKLSAYVDDVLIYVSDSLISLPTIMAKLRDLQLPSNFKINYNK